MPGFSILVRSPCLPVVNGNVFCFVLFRMIGSIDACVRIKHCAIDEFVFLLFYFRPYLIAKRVLNVLAYSLMIAIKLGRTAFLDPVV